MEQNHRNHKRGNFIFVFPFRWGAAALIWLATQTPNPAVAYQLTPLPPESSLTCPGCSPSASLFEHGGAEKINRSRLDQSRGNRSSSHSLLQPIPWQPLAVSPLPHSPGPLNQLTTKLLQPIKVGELASAGHLMNRPSPTAGQPNDIGFQSATEKTNDSDDCLAEIMEIRAAFGGGVAQMLADSPLQSEENERLFAQQLKNLIGETQLSSHQSAGPMPPMYSQASGIPDHLPASVAAVRRTADEEIQILRRSAQQLEQVAAQLEQAGLYEQADSVRSTGIELWKAARALPFHSNTTH